MTVFLCVVAWLLSLRSRNQSTTLAFVCFFAMLSSCTPS